MDSIYDDSQIPSEEDYFVLCMCLELSNEKPGGDTVVWGYAIRERYEDTRWGLSEEAPAPKEVAHIYRSIARLKKLGLLDEVPVEGEASHRRRRLFRVTEEGQRAARGSYTPSNTSVSSPA